MVSGWPRVSETFAVNELLALHRAGMLAAIIATKPGDPSLIQPGIDELAPLVTVLADLGPGEPIDRQVEQTVRILRALPVPVDAVHGYFAHHPAALAHAVAARLGIGFGFSVHALDVRKATPHELRTRAADAAVVVTCNADAAASLDAVGVRARLLPHGVDTTRFAPAPARRAGRTLDLLAVGRLVEKKGFPTLIDALALLDHRVRLTIVGQGPEHDALVEQVERHALSHRVRLVGRTTHADLPTRYQLADAVIVPSVVDRNGDRDGLPNVVLEAMASGRPVVASDVAAIGTAIEHGHDGLLVAPGDATALAQAIRQLAADPDARRELGRAARSTVLERFDLCRCSARFCDLLAGAYSPLLDGAAR